MAEATIVRVKPRMRRWPLAVAIPIVALAAWIVRDFTVQSRQSLRHFDGHAVGRLETDMWRSYYDHHSLRLFGELIELLREQYHLPFWRSVTGAYHAAHAAVIFQQGHNRAEYERALPDIESFYANIRRGSDVPFPVEETARLELEWWIVHRERERHQPGDLEHSLAALQAVVYQQPAADFSVHAKARAEAMLIRDSRAAAGTVSQADWRRIAELLDTSWVTLQTAVSR